MAVRTEEPRSKRSRGGTIIEIDSSIPDRPRNKPEPRVGIPASGRRGGTSSPRAAEKRAEKALGMHSELPTVLPFSSTLAFAFRHLGGVGAAIEAARLVAEKDARFKRLVYAYDEASDTDKSKLRLESLCELAEITPSDFLGMCTSALFARNMDISRLIAAASHPKVVEATIESAQSPKGALDRRLLHEHAGFVAAPRGMQVNVDASHRSVTVGADQKTVEGGTVITMLPSFEEETMDGTRAIRGDAGMSSVGQKRLASPEPKPEILDAEVVD